MGTVVVTAIMLSLPTFAVFYIRSVMRKMEKLVWAN